MAELVVRPLSELVTFSTMISFWLKWGSFFILCVIHDMTEFVNIDPLELVVTNGRGSHRSHFSSRFCYLWYIWECSSAAAYRVSPLTFIGLYCFLWCLLFLIIITTFLCIRWWWRLSLSFGASLNLFNFLFRFIAWRRLYFFGFLLFKVTLKCLKYLFIVFKEATQHRLESSSFHNWIVL